MSMHLLILYLIMPKQYRVICEPARRKPTIVTNFKATELA